MGKPYDHKADVWAVGVILYEMIMLKKPFESDTINGVLSQITSCAYEPLSEDVDPNLKMLVVALLNKDFTKRPSIIDVANVPYVKAEILAFISENDIEQEIIDILDWIHQEDSDMSHGLANPEDTSQPQRSARVPTIQESNMEEWAEIIRAEIKVQDYQHGWWQQHKRCCTGEQIFDRVV